MEWGLASSFCKKGPRAKVGDSVPLPPPGEAARSYTEADYKSRCTTQMSARKFDQWVDDLDKYPKYNGIPRQNDTQRLLLYLDAHPTYWDTTMNPQVATYDRLLTLMAVLKTEYGDKYTFSTAPTEDEFRFWAKRARFDVWKKDNCPDHEDIPEDILRWLDSSEKEEFEKYEDFRDFVEFVNAAMPIPSGNDYKARATIGMTVDAFHSWLKERDYSKQDTEFLLPKWLIREERSWAPTLSRMQELATALGVRSVPKDENFSKLLDDRITMHRRPDDFYSQYTL
ncbi:MAG: hypothetical protein PHW76_09905 [Alphaproteobacteria bacterium]|nr:hypothetical protein [Alphaproteobacteria bacterium]